MRVKKLNSSKFILINVGKYLIDWNKAPSKGQKKLQKFLYPYLKSHIVLAEMRVPGSLWRFDIVDCNTHIIYEYSPESHHNNYNEFFHHDRVGYSKSIISDFNKEEWANQNGFKVVHIIEDDLDKLSLDYFKSNFEVNIL